MLPTLNDTSPNPNQWLLDLADAFADVEFGPGSSIDSDEWKKGYARAIYRDSVRRESGRGGPTN